MVENPVQGARPRVFRELPCALLGVEVEARGEQLAGLEGELEAVEAAKREDAAYQNAKIKALRAQIAHKAKEVRDRQEMREVEIRELLDSVNGMVTTQRADTGEILSQRVMTEDERQGQLFLAGKPAASGDLPAVEGGPGAMPLDDPGD